MKFNDARAAIYSRLDTLMTASYASIPVRYENRLDVDLSAQVEPFLGVELIFNDGVQASLGRQIIVRYPGAIYLSVFTKQGEGIADALTLLASLADTFKTVTFSGVVCSAPRPLPARPHQGWYVHTLRVPFHFDDVPA